jgi:SAM-dependent methyltransferase
MRYEPIKIYLGKLLSGSLILRKAFYLFLDLLLLRAWHFRKAMRKIKRELPENSKILDAGSGLGQYSWYLARLSNSWKIRGIDINASEINACSDFINNTGKSDRISFATADLVSFIDPGAYDLVISVDVMEHVKEDERVLGNFFISLKNNGLLFITTPSDKGGSDTSEPDGESFIDEHVRNGYSVESISGKLRSAGFNGINILYTYGRPGIISWHLMMKYPVKMISASRFFLLLLPLYYIMLAPVAIILYALDLSIEHREGSGLLVIARKQPK